MMLKEFGEIGTVKDLVLQGFRAGLDFKSSSHGQKMQQGTAFTAEMIDRFDVIDGFIESLCDHESKQVICWLIRFRAAMSVVGDKEAVLTRYFPSALSAKAYADLVVEAQKLPEAKLDRAIDVDLVENFLLGGYGVPGICEIAPGDTVLDLGVFNGNSTLDFARRAGKNGRVIGFEPNPVVSDIARKNLTAMKLNAEIVTAAVGEKASELRFRTAGAASSVHPNGDIVVPCIAVDDFMAERKMSSLDFLKLDIEGHEVPALKGAKETIKRLRPKIAVCIYHLATDLTLIPSLISEYHSGYRFYVRHRARHDGEIVMFCVP